ncbi:MAG: hypothetical protein ACTSP1_18095 [Candidatus Freyarchaeota archaeon]
MNDFASNKVRRTESEEEILERFIKTGRLKGRWEREVTVGRKRIEKIGGPIGWSKPLLKKIDAVCVDENSRTAWVLEVKRELSEKAVGQVLLYQMLYSEDNPGYVVKMGIVCKKSDPWIEDLCEKLGITVFSESEGKKHPPYIIGIGNALKRMDPELGERFFKLLDRKRTRHTESLRMN